MAGVTTAATNRCFCFVRMLPYEYPSGVCTRKGAAAGERGAQVVKVAASGGPLA